MKGILLSVSYFPLQVITETFYVLHQSGRAVDAVHVITTRTGKNQIYVMLLSGSALIVERNVIHVALFHQSRKYLVPQPKETLRR